MPLRYCLLVGPAEARRPLMARLAPNSRWRLRLDTGRMSLLSPSETMALIDESAEAVIVGPLFSNVRPERVRSIDHGLVARIVQSGGRDLIDGHWGGYIAAYAGAGSSEIQIVRAPLGAAPCYYWREDDVWIVASSLEPVVALGLPRPPIAWDEVGRHLLRPDLRTATTCIEGVTELPGGYRLTLTAADAGTHQLWSPVPFAMAASGFDRRDAVERLRRVVLNSVHAWASCFDHVLVQVSGGLDSSIVAAALRRSRTRVSGLTMATGHPEGDERAIARSLAEALGFPLQEALFDASRVGVGRCERADLPRPSARSHAQEMNRITRDALSATGAQAVFTGNSGDAIFCYLESASPLADRILGEGLGFSTWRTLGDIHRLTGAGTPAVLRQAARKWITRRRPYRWRVDTHFLSQADVRETVSPSTHPWFPAQPILLPGKTGHLASLAQCHYHQEAYSADDETLMVSPLLSQPLVEFCLQVPSWMWCEGGINRSLAREAFAVDLPAVVIDRRSKGGTDGLLVEIFERARRALRTWLCDGLLAAQGLLDCDAIRTALAATGPTVGNDYLRLLDLADAEAWARAQ